MKIHCIVDKQFKDKDLLKFRAEMDKNYLFEYKYSVLEASKLTIEERNKSLYYTDDTIYNLIANINADAIIIFIAIKNWKDGDNALRGYKLGRIFNGKYVMVVKERAGYEQTAEHEILHTIDDYVKAKNGTNLATIMGVKDFDEDVVHNAMYWKKRKYDYNEVWVKISPHIREADNLFETLKGLWELQKQKMFWNYEKIMSYKNFTEKDFTNFYKMDKDFLMILDKLFDFIGKVKITSDWREDIRSAHSSGKCVDLDIDGGKLYKQIHKLYRKGKGKEMFIKVKGMIEQSKFDLDDKQAVALLFLFKNGCNRIGLYNGHFHFDFDTTKPQNVLWTGTSE